MGQARRVGSRKHPTGPVLQYQQEERRFCTCYCVNLRQAPKPESSFCPWPTVAVSLTVGTGCAGAAGADRSGCTSLMSVIDECPFFLLSGIDLKKTSKWSPRCDQWEPGPSWNPIAGWEERIPWRREFSHTCIWVSTFSKSVRLCSGCLFSSLWFLPFVFLPFILIG